MTTLSLPMSVNPETTDEESRIMKAAGGSKGNRGITAASLALLALASQAPKAQADDHGGIEKKVLIAVLQPTKGNVAKGVATFTKTPDGVEVRAGIHGLRPNGKHAIHIHEFGDLSTEDGISAGGYFNPDGHDHGLPGKAMRHAGDLGNLVANRDGIANFESTAKGIRTTGGTHAILGRTLVIHAGMDDGGQLTGHSDPRIATGVIGFKNPDPKDVFHRAAEKGEAVAETAASGLKRVLQKVDVAVEKAADKVEEKVRETRDVVEDRLDGR